MSQRNKESLSKRNNNNDFLLIIDNILKRLTDFDWNEDNVSIDYI